jgi:polyferredoxin
MFLKSFCAWLCPVGTVSEFLWRLGRQTFGRNFRLARRLDIVLRSIEYILLGLFLCAVGRMPVSAIRAFLESPYGIVDDVKMLNFFRFLGLRGGIVLALLVIGSVFVQNFWCRYLCPYGALMGLASLASPLRIHRDTDLCIDCGKCAKACPSALPVDCLITVQSAECTGCLECVAECPAAGALFLSARGVSTFPHGLWPQLRLDQAGGWQQSGDGVARTPFC